MAKVSEKEIAMEMGVSIKPTLYLSDRDMKIEGYKVGDEIELKGKVVSMTKSDHKGKVSRNMTVEIDTENDDSEDSVEE